MSAEKKISELELAAALSGTEYFELVQNGSNVRLLLNALIALNNLATVGTITSGTWNSAIQRRVRTIVTGNFAPNVDSHDQTNATALDAGITIGAPTGTPTHGMRHTIRLKDDGTGRALTWNGAYRQFTGALLPATTTANKTLYVELVYNLTETTWDVINVKVQP